MSEPTLVMITMRWRLARDFIHFPMIVSDSPPWWPGTHEE
jgi:hypothetical protein